MRVTKVAKTTVRRLFATAGIHLIKSRFSRYQLELYGSERGRPRYVNLGAGAFRHPHWHNVDMPNAFYGDEQNIHIQHDLSTLTPLPIASGTVEIFYCSHVVEHLSREHVGHLFREVHRCLEPGGIFRVTCPDMKLHYDRFMAGDRWLWPQPSGWGTYQVDIEQRFLEYLATLLASSYRHLSATTLTSEEVRRLANNMPMQEFFDHVCAMLPADANKRLPEGHCNWFTVDKMTRDLGASGFAEVWESRYLQSISPKMRSPCFFDGTCPEDALYVECRK